MRILCCGNRDRGDDAAGVLVAERLTDFGVPAETCTGEALDLIASWAEDADVVVVDAVVTGAPVGTVHRWNALDAKFPSNLSVSSHGFGLSEAIDLARTLNRLPPRLEIWGIEAQHFELGTNLSPRVREAAYKVAADIASEWAIPRDRRFPFAPAKM